MKKTNYLYPCLLFLVVAIGSVSCARKSNRTYPKPLTTTLVTHLQTVEKTANSFRATTTMEYWDAGDRIKGSVLLMGKKGRLLRINALNPSGNDVATDLACDGNQYFLVDKNNNCVLSGPCDRFAVSNLLGINVEPDDLLRFVSGGVPLPTNIVTMSSSWNEKRRTETVVMQSDEGWSQIVDLQRRKNGWAVVRIERKKADNSTLWSVDNKDFSVREIPHSNSPEEPFMLLVPGRTKLVQNNPKAILQIRWNKIDINQELDNTKFSFPLPQGLPFCGSK